MRLILGNRAPRYKVVLDVNIIVSGFLKGDGAPASIAKLWEQQRIVVAISERMIETALYVWKQPYFAKRASDVDVNLAVSLMKEQAELVIPDPSVTGVADDDEDDQVLGAAVSAGADFLVTGDRGLLVIGAYRGIRIVTAREFLTLLEL